MLRRLYNIVVAASCMPANNPYVVQSITGTLLIDFSEYYTAEIRESYQYNIAILLVEATHCDTIALELV